MQIVHHATADADFARRDRLQPGDRVEQRRLAAAGRADKHQEAALLQRNVDALQDFDGGRSFLRLSRRPVISSVDMDQPFTAPAIRPRTK